jgi:hypothetical protein
MFILKWVVITAVNRGDKRTRRVRDRDFVKFERSRRYRDHYRCQEKKSRRGRARDPVFRDPPTPRTSPRSLFADRDPPPSPLLCIWYTHKTSGFKTSGLQNVRFTK